MRRTPFCLSTAQVRLENNNDFEHSIFTSVPRTRVLSERFLVLSWRLSFCCEMQEMPHCLSTTQVGGIGEIHIEAELSCRKLLDGTVILVTINRPLQI